MKSNINKENQMKKKSLGEWKKEVAAKYGTSFVYVVSNNSFEDRGYFATREKLGSETSPSGGRYNIYNSQTYAQKA